MNQWEQDFLDYEAALDKKKQLEKLADIAQENARSAHQDVYKAQDKYHRSFADYCKQLQYKKERGL